MKKQKKSTNLLIFGGCLGMLILTLVSAYLLITGPVTGLLNALGDDDHKPTAIEKAIDSNDVILVEKLLTSGVDPNDHCPSRGHSPLTYVENLRDLKITELLLKHGAHVNECDLAGNVPLIEASAACKPELVNLLLARGADVRMRNSIGDTALHAAVHYSEETKNLKCGIITVLLDHKATIDQKNNSGETPLYIATYLGFEKAFDILVARGANQTGKFCEGNTLLHAAAVSDNPHLVEKLLKKGLAINATGDHKMTPLHTSVYIGMDAIEDNPRMVQFLVKNGADINAKDDQGKTAHDYAIQLSRTKVAAALMAH